ncbi:menaquinone biosynthetic enzyme MqnA/MqnD family protein [Paenibacillus sp. L3-i20]|uniref:menaquinone biosynthetic enzyme MqnA/MqnD family protein n=1 Tax=Paenibacillus sp. L3-i20 TaxID=2905833 RepID=UPI001EDD8A9A|nr:menaquinone biosynthesis protein [Paenibacillus sp. L3-i20]GKU79542.1 chorismate dehydratase [Paenibacillus sp. L3-i20]
MGFNRPITIGEIDYANAWPLFYGFEKQARERSFEVISRVPSELNRLLNVGELDLSAISSFSYGQFAQNYILMPQLSVGSIGRVHSIILFLKEPIEKIRPKRIAVTTASETSVNLLKIIMEMRYECKPDYIPTEPNLEIMLRDADAALLIGDPAIAASWNCEGLYVMDLGEEWNNWTNLGMTYAVVAARKEIVERNGDGIHSVYDALLSTKKHNLGRQEELVKRAIERLGGKSDYWTIYFQSLQYDFGDKLQEGLALYFRYAKQLNLLQSEVELCFYKGQSPQKGE